VPLQLKSNLPPLVDKRFDQPVEELVKAKEEVDNQLNNYKTALDKIKNAKV
jgi:hypothetical protein